MTKYDVVSMEELARRNGLSIFEVQEIISCAEKTMAPLTKLVEVTEDSVSKVYEVTRRGVGIITTDYGDFLQYDFHINDKWQKYSVIVKGEFNSFSLNPEFPSKISLPLRTDSGCETGQVFGDRTCECREQLLQAMKELQKIGYGLIINIPHQDGRGKGLGFKLATLMLQQMLKVDTVESATLLTHGEEIDVRTYSGVICILKFFGISSEVNINLATNNPRKKDVFRENGYVLGEDIPVHIEPTEYTKQHLEAKRIHLGHTLPSKRGES